MEGQLINRYLLFWKYIYYVKPLAFLFFLATSRSCACQTVQKQVILLAIRSFYIRCHRMPESESSQEVLVNLFSCAV